MKALFTGIVFAAAAYFVASYKVEVKVTENAAAACDVTSGGCIGH